MKISDFNENSILGSIVQESSIKLDELKGAPKTPQEWAEYAKKAAQWRSQQPMDYKDPKKVAKAERRTDFEMRARQKAQGHINEVASDIESQIKTLETALLKVRNSTKAIKHNNVPMSIIAEIQQIAKEAGIQESELKYEINNVLDSEESLRSAVYSLEDVFKDKLDNLILQRDESELSEAQGISEESSPCWKNYKQVGMKTKNGKQVPNCVPVEEGGMGGINRCAPAQDVSYEKVLSDVYDAWKGQKVKVK